jgi:hypothetical protein
MLSEAARRIVAQEQVRERVRRAGMFQFQVFKVRMVPLAGGEFVELFLDKVLDMSEVQRVADKFRLPVETQNGRAFPSGTGAKDFMT